MNRAEYIRDPHIVPDHNQVSPLRCNWPALRQQLMQQWPNITPEDLDNTGPNRRHIALLIQKKYRISHRMVENYLRNFERTMPLS